ncbi:hypothetical protein ACFPMF_11120 [Larkinella bovis]|uniref:Uncharacterized protein n=1 Tax=Larkinella bovis TaxID=683041 RepID=A0ABW0IBQ1_9BACT
MFASDEILSLDEIYKSQNEINQLKRALERQALFGEGRLPQNEVDERERHYNFLYFQVAQTARMTTVYDLIGRPDWRSTTELTDAQISREVDRLLLLLAQNGIEIQVSDPHGNADDRRLYSFITRMVFPKEIREIRLPGTCYSIDYNYYCPNHTHACIFIADELLTGLFSRNYDRLDSCLAGHFYFNSHSRDELLPFVTSAFEAYKNHLSGCILVDWTIEKVKLDIARRRSEIHLILHYGVSKKRKPLFTERGQLVCEGTDDHWWFIHRIDFPGLQLA